MVSFRKPEKWKYFSFSQKIGYYMTVMDKKYSYYVDKLMAKKIVKDILKDEIEIPETICILEDYNDLQESDINPNYIIKASHGSSWNIILEENMRYDIKQLRLRLSSWNCLYDNEIEKQYLYIKPKFYIEKKVKCKYEGNNGKAIVFSLFCIHNKVFYIQVIDKYRDKTNHYDLNWNLLDIPLSGKFKMNKPEQLNRMIYLAEKLSISFEFVRIDFYISEDNKIYFSEFTFTPCMGASVYDIYEYEFSKLWT